MRVFVSAGAVADLRRIREFLIDKNLSAASRVAVLIGDAIGSIKRMPGRGVQLDADIRRLTIGFGRAAYLLDYRVDLDRQTVTILRIRHSREAR